jgi:BASS family bile acid:Na+ symporter
VDLISIFYTQVIPVGLWAAMLGLGLSLTPQDIRNIFVMPKAVAIGTFGQHALLPLLAFALAVLFAPTPAIAVGTLILAACPGGLTANAYSFATRADVALSVSLTVVSSLLSLATLPLITYFALAWFLEAGAAPQLSVLETFYTLAALTVVPVGIGMFIRHRWEERSKALIEAVRTATFIFLILLIVAGTIVSFDVLKQHFAQAALVALLLNVGSMVLGYGLGRIFSLPVSQRVAITFDIGVQNVSLASLVILSLLGREEFFVITLVYAVIMKITALTFMFISRKWLLSDASATDDPDALIAAAAPGKP